MAYARFIENDVYVFLDIGGYLTCCGCRLDGLSQCFYSTQDMLDHLEEHKKAGDKVQDYAIEGLKADQEENDEWIRNNERTSNSTS